MKVETIQGIFDVAKNCILFAIVAMVAIFPGETANFLKARGVTKIVTPIGDIDLSPVATALSAATRAVEDASDGNTNEQVKNRLQEAQATLGQANSFIKAQLIDRPAASETAATSAAPVPVSGGWIFVGRVDDSKKIWQSKPNRAIDTDQAPEALTSVVVNDDLYIHDDVATDANHSEGRVLGVLRKGETAQILTPPAFSHALGGGYFVWLKIKRASS